MTMSTDPPRPPASGERGVHAPGGQIDPPESPWRTTGRREVYHNPWLTVTEYEVVRPDGSPGIYGVVDPGDNVSIVALDADGTVHLIGEFRYPTQRYAWMLPSGKVEEGEDHLVAAQRELEEETGLRASDWMLLGAHPLSDGISTQISYIYLARGLATGDARPEGTEQLAQRGMPLRDAVQACRSGTIADATSALGLWGAWFFLHGLG